MPYTKTTWNAGAAPGISAANLNNLETQYDAAAADLAALILRKAARFVVGTSTAGWTSADCDYLCDGTADQTEINAAITALPATGGEVIILDGTYNITAKINVTKSNVSIRGNGNATILKRMWDSTVDEGVITLASISGCLVEDLQVDGNKASYAAVYNHGIYLVYGSSSNTVTGNTCDNNNNGVFLSGSSSNTVTGNTCDNNSNGVFLSGSSNNTVTGNTCNNNNNGVFLADSSSNTVTGNTCDNNSNLGVFLSGSSSNTVTGNTCNNNSSSSIRLTGSSSNNTVTGNTYNNNNNSGIYLSSSDRNNVTGNTCMRGTGLAGDYTAAQYTIYLNGTGNDYNLVSSNLIMGKDVVSGGGTGNTLVNNKFA